MAPSRTVREVLLDLVAIPSVNPSLGDTDTSGETEVAAYVEAHLRGMGVEVQLQPAECGRQNVIAHIDRGPNALRGVILLTAHMDTYPSSSDNALQRYPRIHNGRVYGRGAADCKASLATIMEAIIRASRCRDRREAYVVATVDEEYGLSGAKALAHLGVRPQLAITSEPTSLVPIVAQKGIVRSSILVSGNAMHAAYPHGQNVLNSAARILLATESFNTSLQQLPAHLSLSPATIVPTRLIGNGGMNVSPATATLWFDGRFLPGTSAEQFLASFRNFIDAETAGSVRYEFATSPFVSPPNECPLSNAAVQKFFECVRNVTRRCRPEAFSYGSEAGVLAQFSDASLVFGPGDPRCCHADDEYVDLPDVDCATTIYERLLTVA
jgi:acetylornithine deacetylase